MSSSFGNFFIYSMKNVPFIPTTRFIFQLLRLKLLLLFIFIITTSLPTSQQKSVIQFQCIILLLLFAKVFINIYHWIVLVFKVFISVLLNGRRNDIYECVDIYNFPLTVVSVYETKMWWMRDDDDIQIIIIKWKRCIYEEFIFTWNHFSFIGSKYKIIGASFVVNKLRGIFLFIYYFVVYEKRGRQYKRKWNEKKYFKGLSCKEF